MTAVVLSSETPEATKEYYARISGNPEPAPAAVESDAPAATVAEGENGEQQEQAAQQPEKPASKVHVRFSELTEQAKAAEEAKAKAEADLAAERHARALAEQNAAALRAKYEPPKQDIGPKPARDQFVNDDEWTAALEDWTTEKVTRETEARTRAAAQAKTWEDRQVAARTSMPDYDTVIGAATELQVRNEVRDAIVESEQGPQILYHLAKNPAEVAKLATMTPEASLRYIGKLEGKFEGAAAPAPAGKPAPAAPAAAATEISRAPAPINPLKGGNAIPDSPVDADGVFHGTFAEYKAARAGGKIR